MGLEVATKFLEIIMSAVVSQGAALAEFATWLGTQGDQIRAGASANQDTYNTVTVSVTSEAMQVGNGVVYVPKLHMYYIFFDRTNLKVTTICGSVEHYHIVFEYQEITKVFNYGALQDPAVKKKFDDFLSGAAQRQIDDANTFFEGDFPADLTMARGQEVRATV